MSNDPADYIAMETHERRIAALEALVEAAAAVERGRPESSYSPYCTDACTCMWCALRTALANLRPEVAP